MLQCGWYVHVEWVELLLNFCFDSAAVRPALASALTSLAAFLLFFSSIYTQTLAPSKLGFPSLSLSVVTLVVSRAAFVRGTKQTNKQTNKQSLARDRGSRVLRRLFRTPLFVCLSAGPVPAYVHMDYWTWTCR